MQYGECDGARACPRSWSGLAPPVIGTVPAISPAAAVCESVAIWRYPGGNHGQPLSGRSDRGIRGWNRGSRGRVPRPPTPSTEATERAPWPRSATPRPGTPDGVQGVVLGCTHYPLLRDEIVAALPEGVLLFDSAEAVARQTLRRIDAAEMDTSVGSGTVEVFVSGRPGSLPSSAEAFDAGRLLGAIRA